MSWTMDDAPDLRGRKMIVTGCNSGIGLATTRALAAKGATVVMACRNEDKGKRALDQVRAAVAGADLRLLRLDLANLASVRQFAVEVQNQIDRVDGLINNAGVMMPPLGHTDDGFETQFGTNVLGHFALTGLLLPLLERAPGARVVWLSSLAHWVGRIDFNNLNAEKGYSAWNAYAQSKLADMMLGYELNMRLQRKSSTVQSLVAHPGGTQSDLGRHNLVLRLLSPLAQRTDTGALPSLRAALDPAAKGGEYYGPGGLGTVAGPPVRQRSSPRARNAEVSARLWTACEELTKMSFLS